MARFISLYGLQIFHQRFKLFKRFGVAVGAGVTVILNAMLDVIMDKNSLGVRYCALDGMKLLRQFEAWAAPFHHTNQRPQMPLGPFQTLYDVGMRTVLVWIGDAGPSAFRLVQR